MSRFNNEIITCPSCKTKQELPIASSLNVSNKPIFRKQILEGTFQHFICPKCGCSYYAEDPFIYFDFDHKLMVAQFPSSWKNKWSEYERVVEHNYNQYLIGEYAAPSIKETSYDFTLRTVFGLEALSEKILCFENNIDDRLLSILKLQMMQSIEGLQLHPEFTPILCGLNDLNLLFRVCIFTSGEPRNETISVESELAFQEIEKNRKNYQQILRLFEKATYIDINRIFIAS